MDYNWGLILPTAKLMGYKSQYERVNSGDFTRTGHTYSIDLVHLTVISPNNVQIFGGNCKLETAVAVGEFNYDVKFTQQQLVFEVYYLILRDMQKRHGVFPQFESLHRKPKWNMTGH
jgi:hypothetical protein